MADPTEEVDYDRLERSLRALAYANRLELLHILRFPRALSEVKLAPQQTRAGENPTRPMARASVQEHVDKLIEAGVVVQGRSGRESGGRVVNEYQVNPQRLYVILEELRRVFAIPGQASFAPEMTSPLASSAETAMPPGPKLVLVRGLLDGKVFPLREDALKLDPRGWMLGRRAGLPVPLEYDPFVSVENALIVKRPGGGFALVDLPTAKNGTFLNWGRLAPSEEAPLTPGDIIGVGRSLLVFRDR